MFRTLLAASTRRGHEFLLSSTRWPRARPATQFMREREGMEMHVRRSKPPHLSGATRAENPCDPSFSTVEVSILCCFGMDLRAERSNQALRAALMEAGLPGSAAGYLIRCSPLLERADRGQYRLRPFRD